MKLDVSLKEVFRYLGYHNHVPDQTIQKIAIDCVTELLDNCVMKEINKRYSCIVENKKIIIDNRVIIESKNLSKNLADCKEVILFAATLGTQADRLIKKYSFLEISKAVVMQAAAAAVIEEYCDQCQKKIETELEKENLI